MVVKYYDFNVVSSAILFVLKYYLAWRQADCWLQKDIVIQDVCGRLKKKGGLFKLEIKKTLPI